MLQLSFVREIDPTQIIAVLVSVAVFATILSFVLPYLRQDELRRRMKSVAIEREIIRIRERERLAGGMAGERFGRSGDPGQMDLIDRIVERLKLKQRLITRKTGTLLQQAGYRGQRQATLYVFSQVALPISLFVVTALYIFKLGNLQNLPIFLRGMVCLAAGACGYLVPSLLLQGKVRARQQSIARAWPDALDLLTMCVEAGLALDPAIRRVADVIGVQSAPLAEELTLLSAELAYLEDRRTAYENLCARTGLNSLRPVTAALLQAERYGTSMAIALRTLSQESRDTRMNLAEKKAASLPPKLTVPMIVFFLPALFAVILGPAILQVIAKL